MKFSIARLVALAALFAPASADAVPKVVYRVEASTGSWRPLSARDLAKTIEHAALEVLTRPGLMQLEKEREGESLVGDYVLTIRGRLLDEAETHSVYLTFGPGTKSDVPSFRASSTKSLSKLSRSKMLARIEKTARDAAAQMIGSLRPALSRVQDVDLTKPPTSLLGDKPKNPWAWPKVRVSTVPFGSASGDLYSKDHAKRQAALRLLTSMALSEATPRNVLERCAMTHTVKQVRKGCLEALRPLSREHPPTQHVVIEVFRKESDSQIRREAEDQMHYFSGVGREEAIQAWMESLSLAKGWGPLDGLGDLPNLDFALRSCLIAAGKARETWRKRLDCIRRTDPIPLSRRRAILWPFLQETNASSQYYLESDRVYGDAAKAILELSTAWDPNLEELLWKRFQRTLSASSVDLLGGWAPPSARVTDRLLEVLATAGDKKALWGLRRIGQTDASLRPKIIEKLSELLHTGAFNKKVGPRDIENVIKTLERVKK